METQRIYKDLGVLRVWYQVFDTNGRHRLQVLRTSPREVPDKGE